MKSLVERLGDLQKMLEQPQPDLQKIADLLGRIRRKMSQSLKINISGEKLITFLVDDFLDLAQVR